MLNKKVNKVKSVRSLTVVCVLFIALGWAHYNQIMNEIILSPTAECVRCTLCNKAQTSPEVQCKWCKKTATSAMEGSQ
jgi:hypothetical protein